MEIVLIYIICEAELPVLSWEKSSLCIEIYLNLLKTLYSLAMYTFIWK